jgi:hypothetical protein
MFDLKIMIILRELASIVVAPFILWLSLPKSCDKIVDFFREFSVHVDGLGYVCSFAMFNFDKRDYLGVSFKITRKVSLTNCRVVEMLRFAKITWDLPMAKC